MRSMERRAAGWQCAGKIERKADIAKVDALHTAICNVLTPAQPALVSAHKPAGP